MEKGTVVTITLPPDLFRTCSLQHVSALIDKSPTPAARNYDIIKFRSVQTDEEGISTELVLVTVPFKTTIYNSISDLSDFLKRERLSDQWTDYQMSAASQFEQKRTPSRLVAAYNALRGRPSPTFLWEVTPYVVSEPVRERVFFRTQMPSNFKI